MRRFFIFLCLGTGLSLWYVQQRVSLITEGYLVEKSRLKRDDLLDQHRVLNYNVFTLQSPIVLDRRLVKQEVRLTAPTSVEILQHPIQNHSPAPISRNLSEGEPTWWRGVKTVTTRWLESGQQAEAQPAGDR